MGLITTAMGAIGLWRSRCRAQIGEGSGKAGREVRAANPLFFEGRILYTRGVFRGEPVYVR
jgi:hypothetical protein